jgi:hypothetical protein
MKIYLDTCCLNRPFNDQRQERIRIETEAVIIILERLSRKEWTWIGSQVLKIEIECMADADRQSKLYKMLMGLTPVALIPAVPAEPSDHRDFSAGFVGCELAT